MAQIAAALAGAAAVFGCKAVPSEGARPAATHAAPATSSPTAELTPVDAAVEWTILVERPLARSTMMLATAPEGQVSLLMASDGREPQRIRCDDPLAGAWGLWVDDVDGDGNAEAIVALHKRARFDDRMANRLHVYSFEHGRCVPAWRGTRLAGRFDGVRTDPEDHGSLVVHEWLSPHRRRVARYRWQDFGYRVEGILWEGSGVPPDAVTAGLSFGPAPTDASPPPGAH